MASPTSAQDRKRLVFHVGLPKTGTTTIQYYCLFNKQALARDGVHVPSDISRLPTTPDGLPIGAPQLDGAFHFFDVQRRFRETSIDWDREVTRLSQDDTLKTMLISSENIFFEVENVRRDRLTALPKNVSLGSLVCLRHPITFLNSLVLQLSVGLNVPWDRFLKAYRRYPMEYARDGYLRQLDAMESYSDVTVLSFERERKNDTLLQSVMAALRSDHLLLPSPGETNVKSYGYHTGVLFTAMRAVRPEATEQEMNAITGPLSQHCLENDTSGKFFLSDPLYSRIVERWEKERPLIEDRYGIALQAAATDDAASDILRIPTAFAEDVFEPLSYHFKDSDLDWMKQGLDLAISGYRLDDDRAVRSGVA